MIYWSLVRTRVLIYKAIAFRHRRIIEKESMSERDFTLQLHRRVSLHNLMELRND